MLKSFDRFEIWLSLGVCIMPFTLLRFGFLGVGELIMILLFLSELKNGALTTQKNGLLFSKFWILFLLLCSIGFMINLLLYDLEFGTVEGALFDTGSYMLVTLSLFTVEIRHKRNPLNFLNISKVLFFTASIILTTLYIISLARNEIFGLPLRYFGSFAPLVNNIHQTSMFIVPLPFLGVFLLSFYKRWQDKLLVLVFVVSLTIMILDFRSFKALAGFGLGVFVWLTFSALKKVTIRIRFFLIVLIISIFIVLFFNLFDVVKSFFESIFAEEDLEGGRSRLYNSGIEVGLNSFLFGLGPGPHLWGGLKFWDAHQTLLTAFLQAGVLGILLLFWFFRKIIVMIWYKSILFAYLVPILVYALGGDIFRRLPVWILILIAYYFAKQHKLWLTQREQNI